MPDPNMTEDQALALAELKALCDEAELDLDEELALALAELG